MFFQPFTPLLGVVRKSKKVEAAIANAIPNQKLTAMPPSTDCPSPAHWSFDHGMVTRRDRKNAGKKHAVPKMSALTCP
jgi:hypothetical protein